MSQMLPTVNNTLSSPPAMMAGGPSGENAIAKSFIAARTVGYLARVAIDGPDRAAEDSYASSLGYSIGRLPLVPLSGNVVAHNPTDILETYQTNWSFDSVDGAKQLISSIIGSADSGPDDAIGRAVPVKLPINLNMPIVAFHHFNGPNDGEHESVYLIAARLDDEVVGLSVQGGAGLTAQQASRVALAAIGHARQACSNPESGN